MERKGLGSRHSSPYGQACMQCFKAKCRCIVSSTGSSCERCVRLKKQCVASDPIRKRNLHKRQGSDARIAQLESRIDGLTSMLQSVTQSPSQSVSPRKASHETSALSSISAIAPPFPVFSTSSASIPTPTPSLPDTPPLLDPTDEEAEAVLDKFRSRFLPSFPFIHIPPQVTAEQLRRDRPLLFRAIVTVTRTSTRDKIAHNQEFKRLLAQLALLENESNLDLLVSLLTYVAWSHDPFMQRTSALTRLMMLAMSIVYDLRLDRPPPSADQLITKLIPGVRRVDGDEDKTKKLGSLERQRAVLACFILSSVVSSYFAQQMDAMRWTPQMEQALEAVTDSDESPTDCMFAFQVRLQLLAQRATNAREEQEKADERPSMLYLKALRRQLQELKASFPPQLRENHILLLHASFIDVYILEAARPVGPDDLLVSGAGSNVSGYERLECLWQCVDAVKSFFDLFQLVSPSTALGLAFNSWAQYLRCNFILKRLCALEDPAWDRQAVREVVDIGDVMRWMADKIELTSQEAGEQSEDDLFRGFSKMMRARSTCYTSDPKAGNSDQGSTNASIGNHGIMDNDVAMMQAIDFTNENWFEELFTWTPISL